jgi:hypothetical protein
MGDHASTRHMVLLAASVSPIGKDLIVKIQLYIEPMIYLLLMGGHMYS